MEPLPQGILHEARLPLTYSPVLQVVVNTALAVRIEQSQEGVRYVVKEAGDGFPSAARGNLKHGDVSGGIAGRYSQVKRIENSPGAGYQNPHSNRPPQERILLLYIVPFLQRSCLCVAWVTTKQLAWHGTQPCPRAFLHFTCPGFHRSKWYREHRLLVLKHEGLGKTRVRRSPHALSHLVPQVSDKARA